MQTEELNRVVEKLIIDQHMGKLFFAQRFQNVPGRHGHGGSLLKGLDPEGNVNVRIIPAVAQVKAQNACILSKISIGVLKRRIIRAVGLYVIIPSDFSGNIGHGLVHVEPGNKVTGIQAQHSDDRGYQNGCLNACRKAQFFKQHSPKVGQAIHGQDYHRGYDG